ncbi:MAG: DUF4058 family protein [Rivularia sp. (in: Bacteria)]|nr:DUF4058 family protein [Rivularia sp. MS3]
MSSPFPGMNPYLENPELWAEVHHRLITAIAIAIAPPIRPKYRVAIEKRTYLGDVDLQSLLAQVYEQAGFDLAIDYSIEPVPALNSEDKVWADTLLKGKGLRS